MMMNQKTIQRQRGLTLVELSWAMALGIIVAAGLFSAQRTSVDSFNGAIGERAATESLRDGMKKIRTQVRGARPASITVGSTGSFFQSSDEPFLTFQEPISFDYASGETSWGAGDVEGGTVAYFVKNGAIVSYELTDGIIDTSTREVLADGLANSSTQPSVWVSWIENKNLVALTIYVKNPTGANDTPREVNTMIRVEPLFDF